MMTGLNFMFLDENTNLIGLWFIHVVTKWDKTIVTGEHHGLVFFSDCVV